MAEHSDKFFSSNASVSKADWERIFGPREPSAEPEHLQKRRKRGRTKNRDDWSNKHERWV